MDKVRQRRMNHLYKKYHYHYTTGSGSTTIMPPAYTIPVYTIDEKIKAAKVAIDTCCEDSSKDYTEQYNLALWAIYLLSYADEPSE